MTLPPESYDPKALQDIEDSIAAAKSILAQSLDTSYQQPELDSLALDTERLLSQKEEAATEVEIERLQLGINTMVEQIFAYKSQYTTEDGEDIDIDEFASQFKIEPKHDGSGEMVIYYYPEGYNEPSYELDLVDRGLTELDIPAELQITRLYCANNYLASLESLPAGLTELDCSMNQLTSLDNLPVGLKWLNCFDNQLTNLENLPAGLTVLHCNMNQLTS